MNSSGGIGDGVIDADVHAVVPSIGTLRPYLSAYWQEQVDITGFGGATANAWPAGIPGFTGDSVRRPETGPPGSDPAICREQTLDRWDAAAAIVHCTYAVDTIRNPDAAAEVSSAVNRWLTSDWLDLDARFRGTLTVPGLFPEAAAAEVRRAAADDRFVQVGLPARSAAPYGRREYFPLIEAAVDHGLPIAIEYGGFGGNPTSSVGWPSYYIEDYVGMAGVAQSQLLSLIVEGAFDRYPDLRVVFADTGFTWLPSFLWRADKDWKGLRREIPWVRKAPSEYIREHVRFTVQPLDAPEAAAQLPVILPDMWDHELLMLASDYPHDAFATPRDAFPIDLGERAWAELSRDTAAGWYGLDAHVRQSA